MLDRQSSTDAPGGRGAEPQRKLGAAAALKALWPPDLQLAERPRRRKLSAECKLAILAEADAATKPGEIGALLRREGLYSSRLSMWRAQREEGALQGLGRRRGRKGADPREQEILALRRRAERAEAELQKARKVIEIQGNVLALSEAMLGDGSASSTGQ